MPNLFNDGTNRQGLIVYGGESSSNYGMVVAEAPAYERPKRKETIFTVPGRNGTILFQEDAWEDVTRSYKVWLAEDSVNQKTLTELVDAYEAALNSQTGYQMLMDNFEPDVYRLAYYSGGDSFSNEMMQYGSATLQFTCRPERFLVSGMTIYTMPNGGTLENPTKFNSKPFIHIEVETPATISISIGAETITAEVNDYINIDCDRMDAYRLEAENRNNKVSGVFPTLKRGTNTIVVAGNASDVQITPRWFTV